MYFADAKNEVLATIKSGSVPVLVGPKGCGKSSMLEAIAHEASATLQCSYPSTWDATDGRGGLPVPNMETKRCEWLPHGDIARILDAGLKGPVLWSLEEIGQAPASIQAVLAPIILDRRVGDFILPPTVRCVASTNRTIDNSGVSAPLGHLKDRARLIPLDVSFPAWEVWATAEGNINPKILAFLHRHAEQLHKLEYRRDWVSDGPTPRAWERLSRRLNYQMPQDSLLLDVLTCDIGEAASLLFAAFLRIPIPDPADVAKDPMGTPIPADLDAQYATAACLAQVATLKNYAAFIKYLARFKKNASELSALWWKTAARSDDKIRNALKATPEFQEFAVKNFRLIK